MARLREINVSLDNQLRNLNRKIIASARSYGEGSETYSRAKTAIEGLHQATNAPITYKTINGIEVPQISRQSSYYQNLQKMNEIALNAQIAGMKHVGSIEKEVKSFFTENTITPQKKSLKAQIAEMKKRVAIREQQETSDFAILTTWLGNDYYNVISLEEAIVAEQYDAYIIDLDVLVARAISEEEGYIEALKKDYEKATGEEKLVIGDNIRKTTQALEKAKSAWQRMKKTRAIRRREIR